jgi:hypothetical protein
VVVTASPTATSGSDGIKIPFAISRSMDGRSQMPDTDKVRINPRIYPKFEVSK